MSPVVRDVVKEYPGAQPVVVVDIKMSFNSMVWFMVKWAIAAIPALIILYILGSIGIGLFIGVGRSL
ncbi:MAG: hypothetical protein FHK79_18080 [Pseudomonas sp.]|nr:MAG: hypothetical protein FHK79_18080 [Pseudomonas sp.]